MPQDNRNRPLPRAARRLLAPLLALGLLLPILPPPATRADDPTSTFTSSAVVAERLEFSPTATMKAARCCHTATLLPDGRVLIAAGDLIVPGKSTLLRGAEAYDPASGAWHATGNLNIARAYHTATLLGNGQVLVTGGEGGGASAELYDPATGTWSATGNMSTARSHHTATLLTDGKVLVAGGRNGNSYLSSAELCNPSTGMWSVTGSMTTARASGTATLLPDGKVLAAGGHNGDGAGLGSTELYDPTTGAWSATDSMATEREEHTATLLADGRVLIAGGRNGSSYLGSAELYNPSTNTWSLTDGMSVGRSWHTATLLSAGMVMVAGGWGQGGSYLKSAEFYHPDTGAWTVAGSLTTTRTYHTATLFQGNRVLLAGQHPSTDSVEVFRHFAANSFTATLTLPSSWITGSVGAVQFLGNTSAAALNAGALSNGGGEWGTWLAASPGVTATTAWDYGPDGATKPVALRLRDVNEQVAAVVTGTVSVDTVPPTSSMTALPATSPSAISLAWSGTDATSGISGYDVQVRVGSGGTWTDLLTGTSATTTTYNGTTGNTYYFRARATDVAGNVEAWPADYDTLTVVDTEVPGGALVVNHGALATTARNVQLALSASGVMGTVSQMRFGDDGTTWGAWQAYAATADYSLPDGDGLKSVYGQFKDAAGNVSEPVSDTITLDAVVGINYSLSINEGDLFTNQVTVTLSIGAPARTWRMEVSNDGGFAGATAEAFDSRREWQITQYGSYVIPRTVYVRWLDLSDNVLDTRSDEIILDVNAPSGSVEVTSGVTGPRPDQVSVPAPKADGGAVAVAEAGDHAVYLPLTLNCYPPPATGPANVTLHLTVTDDVSGVSSMMINNRADFTCASWESYATHKAWNVPSGTTTVYVRFRDNAGNVSATVSDTITR
jgi:N-acetylneuraminic acid mutarotase